ncbi:NUC189-domain-containing protein [Microthyrium microscopicum]|uniref:NUC189-domain-containing protein n=1 Tax=Microthyrium microscopicum TaxID=703497 RepID=A0A6A6U8H2_9PEZI|nr:NUC189-domain-containing protein [Microthyrium microscopicum]
MPSVTSRSRKADELLGNERAAKKIKTSTTSHDRSEPSLKSALLSNGNTKKLEANLTSTPNKTGHVVNETNATISNTVGQIPRPATTEVIELSSNSESSDESEDDDEEPDSNGILQTNGAASDEEEQELNGISTSDKENEMELDPDSANDEVTFGDLVQAGPIDVEAALKPTTHTSTPLAPRLASQRNAITSTSLGTVLTQALNTNDRELIEECYLTHDLDAIRATIARLQPQLVEKLLQNIADKLHKRPGRASNLMVWVQWSLVSHGGYLATRADVVNKLSSLNRVIRERASGLQSLLTLKGKLDMLNAQLELRREAMELIGRDSDDDEEVVIYVEGQENELPKGGIEDDDLDVDDDALAGAVIQDEDDDSDDSEDFSDDESVSADGFSGGIPSEPSVGSASEDEDEESEPEPVATTKASKKGKGKKK